MKKVLISGAGIAGPALAYWLGRRGIACSIVERAPALRTGGQAVDFRGPVHREVLTRMDLWDPIHARRTTPGDLVILDAEGRTAAALPAVMMAGDVEILRGDLCELLHARTRDATEYRFGDHITKMRDHADGVDVTFASGEERSFDLVVGADGLHSGVRAIAFGDEGRFLRHHGYRIASFAMPDALGVRRGAMIYSAPGCAVCVGATGSGDARALLVHTGAPFGPDRRDAVAQKRAIREVFADLPWDRTPRVLDALDGASDLYVDAIATVHVDRYAKGRIALLGDAAYGGTLGGQGTSLGIVGAYVLAGEIAQGGDLGGAFARYEAVMRPYATRCQKGAMNAGPFFAPKTRAGLAIRNLMYRAMTSRPLLGFFEWLVKDAATDLALPEYA